VDVLRRLLRTDERREAVEDVIARRGGYQSYAGVTVNTDSAMRHLTVWACVSLITDAIAQLPLDTFREGASFPEPIENPQVIERPHAEMTRFAWHVRMLWSVLMRGNAYARVIERGRGGIPLQLEPQHPDEVTISRNKQTGEIEYLVGSSREVVAWEDMLHIPGLVVPGSSYGLDPVSYARQTIGTGLAAEEYGARFFSEGAVPPGVLSTDQKLDLDTALEYQTRWEDAHGNRRRKVAVLGGGLKYDAIQITPEASQFLSTIGATRSQIAAFFRVPPHLIGDADNAVSAWGSGMEELGRSFTTYTLGPWLKRLEDAWVDVLGGTGAVYARYNTKALLRSRLTERYQAYTLARNGGWLSVDEIRAYEELAPLDDGAGSGYLKPLNMGELGAGDEDRMSLDELALNLQKMYLAVGVVLTVDEAREILNREGAGFGPTPESLLPIPPSVTPPAP
jgi:HK97 family phage portal protein